MGLFDSWKNMFGTPEDEEETESPAPETEEPIGPAPSHPAEQPVRSNTVNIHNIHATAQLQVVLVKPERYDDASGVADHLNAKRTVVLNLESANKDVARRILDFLSGVAYANDGQIKRVANCTYIITPYNVGLMGDLLDELENNGLYF